MIIVESVETKPDSDKDDIREHENLGQNPSQEDLTKVACSPEASVSKSGDQFPKGRTTRETRAEKSRPVKLWLALGSLNLTAIIIAIVAILYYANGRKAPSLECLSSLASRCNPLFNSSTLAGVLWHGCSSYCNNCKGASFGVCTVSPHLDCFRDGRLSRTCFCYGGSGIRNGDCWL